MTVPWFKNGCTGKATEIGDCGENEVVIGDKKTLEFLGFRQINDSIPVFDLSKCQGSWIELCQS